MCYFEQCCSLSLTHTHSHTHTYTHTHTKPALNWVLDVTIIIAEKIKLKQLKIENLGVHMCHFVTKIHSEVW